MTSSFGMRLELEALRESVLGVPDVVRRVQNALDALSSRATSAAVARLVGTGTRTLQRGFAACGSSLRLERRKRVVRASERLLEGTELSLTAIASMAGASSPSHLVTLFREHRGTTPGQFRSRLRLL